MLELHLKQHKFTRCQRRRGNNKERKYRTYCQTWQQNQSYPFWSNNHSSNEWVKGGSPLSSASSPGRRHPVLTKIWLRCCHGPLWYWCGSSCRVVAHVIQRLVHSFSRILPRCNLFYVAEKGKTQHRLNTKYPSILHTWLGTMSPKSYRLFLPRVTSVPLNTSGAQICKRIHSERATKGDLSKIFFATELRGEGIVALSQLKVYTEMHQFLKKLMRTRVLRISL